MSTIKPNNAGGHNPVISIVMPLYKEAPAILSRTIDALLTQTFVDFELVTVVDNPDNHDAIRLLQEYKARDSRVHYFINPKNLGVWASYNNGIRNCRGQYIAIQDADDVSHPNRLCILHTYLSKHPEVDVVGAALNYVDEHTGQVMITRNYPPHVQYTIKRYCPIAHGTTLRKASLHEVHGYYDESLDVRHAADYELWCRWHIAGVKIRNLPDVLYDYQQSPLNFKSNNVRMILRDTVRIKSRYARQLGFGFTDYAYLLAEAFVGYLPSLVIVWLFYHYNRIRSSR